MFARTIPLPSCRELRTNCVGAAFDCGIFAASGELQVTGRGRSINPCSEPARELQRPRAMSCGKVTVTVELGVLRMTGLRFAGKGGGLVPAGHCAARRGDPGCSSGDVVVLWLPVGECYMP